MISHNHSAMFLLEHSKQSQPLHVRDQFTSEHNPSKNKSLSFFSELEKKTTLDTLNKRILAQFLFCSLKAPGLCQGFVVTKKKVFSFFPGFI